MLGHEVLEEARRLGVALVREDHPGVEQHRVAVLEAGSSARIAR